MFLCPASQIFHGGGNWCVLQLSKMNLHYLFYENIKSGYQTWWKKRSSVLLKPILHSIFLLLVFKVTD
ncbi:hypothetical protein ACET3Z_009598 [Daucus carota]